MLRVYFSADFRYSHLLELVFELVSGYGTVGLSLGIPTVRAFYLTSTTSQTNVDCVGELFSLRRISLALQAHPMRGHVAWQTSGTSCRSGQGSDASSGVQTLREREHRAAANTCEH